MYGLVEGHFQFDVARDLFPLVGEHGVVLGEIGRVQDVAEALADLLLRLGAAPDHVAKE